MVSEELEDAVDEKRVGPVARPMAGWAHDLIFSDTCGECGHIVRGMIQGSGHLDNNKVEMVWWHLESGVAGCETTVAR